jgi:hypothetical protein
MKKKINPQLPRPFSGLTPGDKQWLNLQFDDVDKALERVLRNLKKLEKALSGNVSPELEAAINEVAKRAQSIDEKVPD